VRLIESLRTTTLDVYDKVSAIVSASLLLLVLLMMEIGVLTAVVSLIYSKARFVVTSPSGTDSNKLVVPEYLWRERTLDFVIVTFFGALVLCGAVAISCVMARIISRNELSVQRRTSHLFDQVIHQYIETLPFECSDEERRLIDMKVKRIQAAIAR
jgi:hypothetical protein